MDLIKSVLILLFGIFILYLVLVGSCNVKYKQLNWYPDGGGACGSCWMLK